MPKVLHTPGPWRLDGNSFVAGDDILVGCTWELSLGDGVAQANARLIAKAPEMLTYIKRYLEEMEDHPVTCRINEIERVRALLAQIEPTDAD